MNDYKELCEELRSRMRLASIDALWPDTVEKYFKEAADAIEQLMHERFLIGEILVTASKWEIEPETACEQIRRVLRGDIKDE